MFVDHENCAHEESLTRYLKANPTRGAGRVEAGIILTSLSSDEGYCAYTRRGELSKRRSQPLLSPLPTAGYRCLLECRNNILAISGLCYTRWCAFYSIEDI